MNLDAICRWLNRSDVSAAPCPWIGAISIFVDERYENFDFDVLGPAARRRISRVFEAQGWRRRGSRVFEGPEGRVELPRAARSLSSDPAHELESILKRDGGAAVATPTQVVFLTLRRSGAVLPNERADDLAALVHEQPANLDKVRDWLRRSDSERAFWQLRPRLAERQKEGCELRRRHGFSSRLPR